MIYLILENDGHVFWTKEIQKVANILGRKDFSESCLNLQGAFIGHVYEFPSMKEITKADITLS